jgi:hypothetical protein
MKRLGALVALMLSNLCHASGWTGELNITSAFTEGKTDWLIVYTSNGGAYASGCSVNNWVFSFDTSARGARAYATILAAMASGKKVKFWYSDTCGVWSYHEATSVMLVN